MANYSRITCATACNKIKSSSLPYNWDLNIYRGCEHQCKYCFAIYSHGFTDMGNFYSDIYEKVNIIDRLEEQLKSPSWNGEIINIGGVTDSYQPLENKCQLMPKVLKLLIKYKNPCIISTKSDLILRDYELIEELSNLAYVNIAATVTTIDEDLRAKMEPGAVSSKRRINMLKEFSKTNASIGFHCMPIVPYLTDNRENIEGLFSAAMDCNADYLLAQALNLRGKTREIFYDFLIKEYRHLYEPIKLLYKTDYLDKDYKTRMNTVIREMQKKYGISSEYKVPKEKWIDKNDMEQLSLF